MYPVRVQVAMHTSFAVLLLALLSPTAAFVARHGPMTTLQSAGKVAAVSPPTPRGDAAWTAGACLASSSSRNRAALSMAFDLGEMMDQIKSSMNGGGSGGSGGGANGKRVLYDAAIVGYGPAGGVMVRVYWELCDLIVSSVQEGRKPWRVRYVWDLISV